MHCLMMSMVSQPSALRFERRMMTPPLWTVIFFLFSSLVSLSDSSSSVCADGTYKHEGRDCCRCGVGKRVMEHCTADQQYGICEECETKTYSSEANGQDYCDRCTSCDHPNDNLEEDEPCTPARDTKCRCKKDHYCVSSTEICRLCHPCDKCGDEGIKEACTGSNNTVCNDKSEGGNHVGTTLGIALGVIAFLVLGVGVSVYLLSKRRRQSLQITQVNGSDVERQHLRDVDVQRHVPAIAEVIGWKHMRDIALYRNIPHTTIQAFQLNNPNDTQEQTIQLLLHWVECQGKKAGMNLVTDLENNGKKREAEKVTDILSRGNEL